MYADGALFPSPVKYGISGEERPSHDETPQRALAAPLDLDPPWSPNSGLFVFGVVAAFTFGLMAVSAHARVGKRHVAVSVGDAPGQT